ncbi:MAG: hypothetical protein NTU83_06145 [Candidatus Hydrogenedentes bacterium]|nr:hypothetical protein [Candidatus Hydrogenedentota bacterium]
MEANEAYIGRLRSASVDSAIERFLITDINNPSASSAAQSSVWCMFDSISRDAAAFNHVPSGGNVLFMDGHVEFVRYPGKAPVSNGMALFVGTLLHRPRLM